jgi:alpha-methylacyl-CoA racemase
VNFADSGSNYYDTYECADGRHVAVGAIEGPFYTALLDGLGLARDELPDRADAANWPALKERFATVFRTRSREEWEAVFDGTDACVAPVLGLTEAPHHPHNVARSVFIERDGIVQPAPAPRFDRTPNELDRLPPAPGEHTAEILSELGYDDAGIAELLDSGDVVGVHRGDG